MVKREKCAVSSGPFRKLAACDAERPFCLLFNHASTVRPARQGEEEGRAFAGFASGPDPAAVGLHDVFDDREAESRAALLA